MAADINLIKQQLLASQQYSQYINYISKSLKGIISGLINERNIQLAELKRLPQELKEFQDESRKLVSEMKNLVSAQKTLKNIDPVIQEKIQYLENQTTELENEVNKEIVLTEEDQKMVAQETGNLNEEINVLSKLSDYVNTAITRKAFLGSNELNALNQQITIVEEKLNQTKAMELKQKSVEEARKQLIERLRVNHQHMKLVFDQVEMESREKSRTEKKVNTIEHSLEKIPGGFGGGGARIFRSASVKR